MRDVTGILNFHAEGLRRVARVIDGNAEYDELMLHKLTPEDLQNFGQQITLSSKRNSAITQICQRLNATNHKMFSPQFNGFACEGNTKNNIREFEFFDRICRPIGLAVSSQNYTNVPRISAPALNPEQSRALDSLTADITEYYEARDTISASLVHQHLLYSQAFFSFFLSFTSAGATWPDALVTANDHSPVRVALSMVMKGLSIPRIYLQHAEVTTNFPPLDFEFSVLRNTRSLETYRKIGTVSGKTFVLARAPEPFDGKLLGQERSKPVHVVIYPTSRVLIEPLQDLLGKLRCNPDVSKITIKEHPGAAGSLADLAVPSVVDVTQAGLTGDHIAIVANSSVAIELLHRGIPVYHNFQFDPTDRDYYGFVNLGIAKEILIEDASRAFWEPYELTSSWLKVYGAWDPSATDEESQVREAFLAEMDALKARRRAARPRETQHSRVPQRAQTARLKTIVKGFARRNLIKYSESYPRAASYIARKLVRGTRLAGATMVREADRVERFLSANTKLRISDERDGSSRFAWHFAAHPLSQEAESFIFEILRATAKPITWLNENERLRIIPPSTLIPLIERVFQMRDPTLQSWLARVDDAAATSAVARWVQIKKAEIANLHINPAQLDSFAEFTYELRGDPATRAHLERALLSGLLRAGTIAQLNKFWAESEALKIVNLSVPSKYQILRKLRQEAGHEKAAEELLRQIQAEATEYEILRLDNSAFLDGLGAKHWNHSAAENDFERLAPPELRRDFIEKVKPTFDNLRPRMQFMDLRSDPNELSGLKNLIREAVVAKKPFSLIRLSDGEGYLFPQRTYFTEEDCRNRERHWWGTELPHALESKIVDEARSAIAEADVIGIPSVYRFIRDNGEGSHSLTHSLQGRGLVEVLAGIGPLASEAAIFTEDKANVALFADSGKLDWLTDYAGRIVVVSSIKKDSVSGILGHLPQVEFIEIPTHHKTTLNSKYCTGTEPLPYAYPKIIDVLGRTIRPGDLTFVAGGIIGKILLGHCRQRGAIAIDLGHVIDDWISPNFSALR